MPSAIARGQGKSFLIGDFKLTARPRRTSARERRQFGAMTKHAARYSYSRMILMIGLREGNDRQRWRYTDMAARGGAFLRIFTFF